MNSSEQLRKIMAVARPLIEESLNIAEQLSALQEVASDAGFKWGHIKKFLKASIADEADGGKRVERLRAETDALAWICDHASGTPKVKENIFSPELGPDASPRTAHGTPKAEAQAPDRAGVSLDSIAIVGAYLPPPPLDDLPDIPPEFDRRAKVSA